MRAAAEAAVDYCKEHSVSIGRLAVHYAANFLGVDSVVVSVRSRQQLLDNVDAVLAAQLGEKDRRVFERVMRR